MQRLHISEVFETEEDDEALERTDITDILSQEAQEDLTVDIQGSILMTITLRILKQKYHDIFSTTVKGKSARVPPFDFKVDAAWETTANKVAVPTNITRETFSFTRDDRETPRS